MNKQERVARVQNALSQVGLSDAVVQLEKNTATAAQAAAALGCSQGQIAKSLMFRTDDNRPILVVLSGAQRVCADKLSDVVGAKVVKANAAFVKEMTGYEIGGVPPIAHPPAVQVIVDSGLCKYDKVWAAAGSAYAVFAINPTNLAQVAAAQMVDVAEA